MRFLDVAKAGLVLVIAILGYGLAMIIGGIGLLYMRNWARVLTIVYAVVSIADKAFDFIYSLMYELPATRAFLQTFHPANDQEKLIASLTEIGMRVGPAIAVLLMIYPMIVLAYMVKRSNREAFQSAVTVAAAPAATDQFEEEDRWGRG